MLKIAVGHSEDSDTLAAAKEILLQCKKTLNGTEPQAALLFASVSYDYPKLLDAILKEYPHIQLSGCSSFGEISTQLGVSEDSAVLMLLASDQIHMQSLLAREIPSREKEVLSKKIKDLIKNESKEPQLCLLFADGVKSNVSDAIEGLQSSLGLQFPIAGGNACDDWKFEQVFQFCGHTVSSQSAAVLLFSGPFKHSMAMGTGKVSFPFSSPHFVTKSEKNILYKIDDQTAVEFYQQYVGHHENFQECDLMIYANDDTVICRSPQRINTSDGSIVFPGNIPQGARVGLAQLSSPQQILAVAGETAKTAYDRFPGNKIEAALIFSCAVRKEVLGTETFREIDLIKKNLPEGIPLCGFYTFGEIVQSKPGEATQLQNESLVIVLIGE